MKKTKEKGGKAVPDLHLFLGSRYAAIHIKLAMAPSRENNTTAMARFWIGSYLKKIPFYVSDHRTPVSFNILLFFKTF